MRIALGCLAVALVTSHALAARAGACAPPSVTATVLTPAGTSLDQDGGVVVGLTTGFGGGTNDDLAKLDWKFAEGGKETAPKTTLVAPGLAVLVPDKPVKQLELRAGKTAKVTVAYAMKPRRDLPIASAPNVKGIKITSYAGPRGGSSDSTDVTLGAAPPTGTVAVLVYDPAEQKAGKLAKSWAAVTAGAKTIQLAYSGRCHTIIAGTQFSGRSDKVVLVWLDASGHASLPSREIEIQ